MAFGLVNFRDIISTTIETKIIVLKLKEPAELLRFNPS